MSLVDDLERAKTEEDVKDAYIKALGLANVTKGQVDIKTPEIWFEAKYAPTAPLIMFAQLLVYVRRARKKGQAIPPFLVVLDKIKAAILPTKPVLSVFDDDSIEWPQAASRADAVLASQIEPYIADKYTTYPLSTLSAEFEAAVGSAISCGEPIRIRITPNNLRQVFDKWVTMIGGELDMEPTHFATIFFADIMHDGTQAAYSSVGASLIIQDDRPAFFLSGAPDLYPVGNLRAYRDFWSIYERPPEERHRRWLIERRDSLLPLDEQKFKGAFYTPLHIVDKAYEQLTETLGEDWQERYIVWDMCAGVGNLQAKHNHPRNVYMSTLDKEDVAFMKTVPAFAGTTIFQYDYLNDDVTDFGEIDYSLTDALPMGLRGAIADAKAGKPEAKPILVLINPPYAESGSGIGKGDENKIGVEQTQVNRWMREMNLGYASKELFVQFLVRIREEIPNCVLAMFSTLKYVNAPNFEAFRRIWKADFLDGFVVHSRAFDDLKGDFPIGFMIWDQSIRTQISRAPVEVLNLAGDAIGEKLYVARPKSELLNSWMARPVATGPRALPLSNALKVSKNPRPKKQLVGSKGYLYASNNDLQHASIETLITSSIYTGGNGGGVYLIQDNLWQAAIVFAVRRLIKPTWLNDRDQFLQPSQPLTDEFKSDCLVWMLFNGSNLTAGADGLEWDDREWSLTNHFIPYAEAEVGATERFESDFMVRYMDGMGFSPEAQAVLDEGRKLWTKFHATSFPKRIREELKLNRADAGWYQIRRALEQYSDIELTDFEPFKVAYAALSDKLRPMVFELGFLPE